MKATEEELSFHRRILARDDPIAFAELASTMYSSLVQNVCKRAGIHADAVLVEEAVGEALLDYHDRPDRYDPERAGLHSYLAMAAYRDFQNAAAKEQRVKARQISLFDPTLQEYMVGEQDTADSYLQAEELWSIINETFSDPVERRLITLILNKTQALTAYAQVLGIEHLPAEEQRKQVQLVKNRLTRRLRRRVERMHITQ
jgi:isopropylmalate/homocitrate/citramalate synthase